jgi:hypothetical protein
MHGMKAPVPVCHEDLRYLEEIRPGYAASLEARGRIVIVEPQTAKVKS